MLYRENHQPADLRQLVVFSFQHYEVKFVSDLRQVGGFLYTTL
jgi:hypothetical protein